MCHHMDPAYTVWRDERESEADEEVETETDEEPAEVDIAEPAIGETEIEQPRLDD